MTIEDLYLTKEQKVAIRYLEDAIKACLDENIQFVNLEGYVAACNGNVFHEDEYKDNHTTTIPFFEIDAEFSEGVDYAGSLSGIPLEKNGRYVLATDVEVQKLLKEKGFDV